MSVLCKQPLGDFSIMTVLGTNRFQEMRAFWFVIPADKLLFSVLLKNRTLAEVTTRYHNVIL